MAKGFIFCSMLLLFVFIIQSSFALEIERKTYNPNNKTYEFQPIKPIRKYNITFNKTKMVSPLRKIFNSTKCGGRFGPKSKCYVPLPPKPLNLNTTIKCSKGTKLKCNNFFGRRNCICQTIDPKPLIRCPLGTVRSCDKNMKCKCKFPLDQFPKLPFEKIKLENKNENEN